MGKSGYQTHGRPGANELLFLPLGGCNEVGMNLNLYGHHGKWLMVDLGITFNDGSLAGVDVIMPDPAFIEERREDLIGLVVTHAHEDHLGAIPHLWQDLRCPIYASPFTAAFLKRKLEETSFAKDVPIHIYPLDTRFTLGPFDIEFVTLTHSIPEPSGLMIRTKAGNLFHTADWKIDENADVNGVFDPQRLSRLGEEGVLALVCDSTNALVPGHSASEAQVVKGLREALADCQNGVAVTCFASNVARLRSIAKVGREMGREPILIGRSLERMQAVARQCGYLDDMEDFMDEKESGKLDPSQKLFICTGSQGEPRAALTRIAAKRHPSVKLKDGDAVIFSSRDIPGNEVAIGRLQNNLARQGIEIITADEYAIHASGHPCRDELRQMYQLIRPKIVIPVHGEPRHLIAQSHLAAQSQVPYQLLPHNGLMVRLDEEGAHEIDEVFAGRLALSGDELIPTDDESLRERNKLAEHGAVMISLSLDRKKNLAMAPQISLLGLSELEFSELADLVEAIAKALEEPPQSSAKSRRKDSAKANSSAKARRKGDRIGGDDDSSSTGVSTIEERVKQATRRYFVKLFGKKPLVAVHLA